jgi:hypothetical protein
MNAGDGMRRRPVRNEGRMNEKQVADPSPGGYTRRVPAKPVDLPGR